MRSSLEKKFAGSVVEDTGQGRRCRLEKGIRRKLSVKMAAVEELSRNNHRRNEEGICNYEEDFFLHNFLNNLIL